MTFTDAAAVQRVFEDDHHEVDDKVVECKRAVPKEQRKRGGERSWPTDKVDSKEVAILAKQ